MLAYLALENRAHTRERLASLLWPDHAREAARRNLRFQLLTLRRQLGDDDRDDEDTSKALVVTRQTLALDLRVVQVDAVDLAATPLACPRCTSTPCPPCAQRLASAAALFRGELLEGVSLPGADELEQWLMRRRDALLRQACAALERSLSRFEAVGDLEKALPIAQRLQELLPWDESSHRRLLRVLASAGQRSAALSHFNAMCARWRRELGVEPETETLRLAEEIRALEEAPSAASERALLVAERRRMTVLCGELRPPPSVDVEDIARALVVARARVRSLVDDLGGVLSSSSGRSFTAYFGFPGAREDDAERAAHAGLRCLADARVVDDRGALLLEPLVALHTGATVTSGGESVPDGAGELEATAARLCALATPGALLASAATRRLIERRFRCEESAAPASQRGSVVVTAALDQAPVEGSWALPLIGRARELEALLEDYRCALAGERRVVVLRGEAGIGKSRLVAALLQRARDDGREALVLRCSPEARYTPFAALSPLSPTLSTTPEEHGGVTPVARAAPRQALWDALWDSLHGEAAPLLVVLEDLHWADPSTLDLLARTLSNGAARGLLLCTARPEAALSWPASTFRELPIGRIDDGGARELLRAVAEGPLSPSTESHILERSDGVPLYLEELTRLVLLARGAAGTRAQRTRGDFPDTLHDLLMARVDRLGGAKRVVQLAAVLGRVVDVDLLHACAQLPRAQVEQGLDRLVQAGLGSRRAGQVTFKHALVQEAAYGSLTRADRRAMHARIVGVVERMGSDRYSSLERRARDLAGAGMTRRAIDAWTLAGQEATRDGANLEAVARIREALALLQDLPRSSERDTLELELQVALGAPLASTAGYGAKETIDAFDRALALSAALRESGAPAKGRASASTNRRARGPRTDSAPPLPFEALYGLWRVASTRRGFKVAVELAETLVAHTADDVDPCRRFLAAYALGESCFWRADFDRARDSFVRALAAKPSFEVLISRHAEDTRVNALSMLAWTLFFLDREQDAYARCDDAIALAAEERHPYAEVTAQVGLNALGRFAHNLPLVRRTASEILRASREHGFALWEAGGLATDGWARALLGDPEGIKPIEKSLPLVRGAMASVETFYLAMLGEAQLVSGKAAQAAVVLAEAIEKGARRHERYYERELQRLHASALRGSAVRGSAVPGDAARASNVPST